MISIIVFLLILGLLIFVHELGHFLAAKKSGVYVEEFGFGFPPRIWGKKIGETIYSVNAIPLGGFVKVYGEEYGELELKKKNMPPKNRAFAYKKPWYKFFIIIAGVSMNLLLGIATYYVLISWNGFQSDPIALLSSYHFRFGTQEGRVIAGNVIADSPAEKAGLKAEDIIVRYQISNSIMPQSWISIKSAEQLIQAIISAENKNIFLELENIRNGSRKTIQVIPNYDKKLKRAIIGVNLVNSAIIKYQSPKQKLFSGLMHSYNIMAYNFSTISQLFSFAAKEKNLEPVTEAVSGPIGIYSVVNEIVKTSGEKIIKNILNVIGLLSLSLGCMNILPFPALDGGKLVFIIFEWITKKTVNKTFEQYTNYIGFLLLILFANLVSVSDVIKFFK